jgi:hypothetical protein
MSLPGMVICVALFCKKQKLVWRLTKVSFLTSFALNLTLLIARVQGHISPKNMAVATHLGFGLWATGMYAIAISYRHGERNCKISRLGIIAIAFCAALEIIVIVFHSIEQRWNYLPPENCGNMGEVIGPEGWYFKLALSAGALSLVSVIVASLPASERFLPWLTLPWLKRGTAASMIVSLIILFVFNEVSMNSNVGVDKQFVSEANQWGLGQVMMAILTVFQVIETVIAWRRIPAIPRAQDQEMQTISQPGTYTLAVGLML